MQAYYYYIDNRHSSNLSWLVFLQLDLVKSCSVDCALHYDKYYVSLYICMYQVKLLDEIAKCKNENSNLVKEACESAVRLLS